MFAISNLLAAAGMTLYIALYYVSREDVINVFLKTWVEADRWKVTEKENKTKLLTFVAIKITPQTLDWRLLPCMFPSLPQRSYPSPALSMREQVLKGSFVGLVQMQWHAKTSQVKDEGFLPGYLSNWYH